MTDRCELFTPKEKVLSRSEAVKEVKASFLKSFQAFQEWAAKNKIQLEELNQQSDDFLKRKQNNLLNARTNDTSKYAHDYRCQWMLFKSKYKTKLTSYTTKSEQKDSPAMVEITDALEIITHFELQLPVKISRSYTSFASLSEEEKQNTQNEANGIAKVVLLGIEKSFPAWETLIQNFPEMEKDCWEFLITLDKIRKRILLDFPNAEAFQRPGFDETPSELESKNNSI